MTLIHDIIYAPGTIFCQKQKAKKQENALVTIYGNLKNIPKLFYAQGIIWIWDDISLVNGIRYKTSIAYFSSNENEM